MGVTPVTEENYLQQQARQGNVKAITALLNDFFAPKKINVQVDIRGRCLRVRLDSRQAPSKAVLNKSLYEKLVEVKPYVTNKLLIQSWQPGAMRTAWSQDFEITENGVKPAVKRNIWTETVAWLKSLNPKEKTTLGLLGLITLFVVGYCGNQNSCGTLRAKLDAAERGYQAEYQKQLNKGVVDKQGVSDFASAHIERQNALDRYTQQCKD